MPVSTFEPRPQCARIRATTESRTAGGARSAPQAHIPYRASASTRPGYRAAIAAASWPPCDAPNRLNRLAPAASATASAAATCASNDRSAPCRSDSPQPGLSYRITVNRPARRSMNGPNENRSSCPRRWVTQPESHSRAGPEPCVE